MQKLKDYNGYRITPTDWGYYVVISDTKANQMRTYEYDGAVYKSLSAVARLITGTRWNGKLFFGVK